MLCILPIIRPKLLAVLQIRYSSLPRDDPLIFHHAIEIMQIRQLIAFDPPSRFDNKKIMRFRHRDAEIDQHPALVVPCADIHRVDAQLPYPFQIPQHLLDRLCCEWYIVADQVFHDGSKRLSFRSWLGVLAVRPIPRFNAEPVSEFLFPLRWDRKIAMAAHRNFPVQVCVNEASLGAAFAVEGIHVAAEEGDRYEVVLLAM